MKAPDFPDREGYLVNVPTITMPRPIGADSSDIMYAAGLEGLARKDAPRLAKRLLGAAGTAAAIFALVTAHENGVRERARVAVWDRIYVGGSRDPEKLIERIAQAADLEPAEIVSIVEEVVPVDDRQEALAAARQSLDEYRCGAGMRASRIAARWQSQNNHILEMAA